ncbi:hypothetical protein P0136_06700 [Lentisphaerota bacterium ZTH]|nr:hypothetical protein JYG24_02190 [Lentisphaerota bacterium]WET07678.1 hypothetical protein P0136_06700 [Lentisphaerota bacterium ZTH]
MFSDHPDLRKELIDGNFDNHDMNNKSIDNINRNFSSLKDYRASSWKRKMLAYLYCRRDIEIHPETAPDNRLYYNYPLLKLFDNEDDNQEYVFTELSGKNILSENRLIDRIFTCPHCFSARLCFSERCPSCNSVNIKTVDFLHCFTCGMVGPEDDFVTEDKLICPKCRAKLNHFGEDYDKTLESGVCFECGEYHTESKPLAFCIDCKKHSLPENLTKHSIYTYNLTDLGRDQILNGTASSMLHMRDKDNYVHLPYFYDILDWFLEMQRVHHDEYMFSILGVKVDWDSYEIISSIAKKLRSIFEPTAIATKNLTGYFWFLLPGTDKKQLKAIEKNVLTFFDELECPTAADTAVKLFPYTAAKGSQRQVKAKTLIAEIATEK